MDNRLREVTRFSSKGHPFKVQMLKGPCFIRLFECMLDLETLPTTSFGR